jgi:hypothetical protein
MKQVRLKSQILNQQSANHYLTIDIQKEGLDVVYQGVGLLQRNMASCEVDNLFMCFVHPVFRWKDDYLLSSKARLIWKVHIHCLHL